MKRIFIFWAICSSISTAELAHAQEISIGMPLSKLLPILADQKCNVDTFREGRIHSYITQLQTKPFVRFGVEGQARFCFDAESDTLQGWEWICDSMAPTDYRFIVQDISRKLRDTGEEINFELGLSHMWNHGKIFVFYYLSFNWQHQLRIMEGDVCRIPPPFADTTSAPTAFALPPPPPPPPPADSSTDVVSENAENFSYEIVKDDADPDEKWEHVTVKLSKKITKEHLASVAKEIRRDKWRTDNLTIDFLLPGLIDKWATASFDADKKDVTMAGTDATVETHLDLTFWLSIAEQRRRALDTIKRQRIDGKVIGVWCDTGFSLNVCIIFEKKGKMILRQIVAASSEEYDGSWVIPDDEELKKSEVEGVTRLLEPDDPLGEYFVINKDGSLELYDGHDNIVAIYEKFQ